MFAQADLSLTNNAKAIAWLTEALTSAIGEIVGDWLGISTTIPEVGSRAQRRCAIVCYSHRQKIRAALIRGRAPGKHSGN